MILKTRLAAFLAIIFIASCQKSQEEPETPPVTPPIEEPVSVDSILLLTNINGDYASRQAFNFEYDSNHNLIKIYRSGEWGESTPCHVFYKNGIINHIVSEENFSYYQKASMIFENGPNRQCSRVFYKKPVKRTVMNDDPYFSDLTDGKLHDYYDSLVYSPTNQLTEIIHLNRNINSKPYSVIKFYYQDLSDTTLNKLEEYHFDSNNSPVLYDQLLLKPSTVNSPIRKLLWFFPFVFDLTYLSGGGQNVMTLPILFDDPSSDLEPYAIFSTKFIRNYQVYNEFGHYNYQLSIFDYTYTPDSLQIMARKQRELWNHVNYNFTKVKR